jgi:large subunit ribosomal protein L21
MYAVVQTGGKQYRVAAGDVVFVEKLPVEAGGEIELDRVLMIGGDIGGDKEPLLGAPLIEGARVAATVLDQARADRIIVFKKKRRHKYRRKQGHRQYLTVLRIEEILKPGAKRAKAKPAPKKASVKKEKAETPAPEKTAAEKTAKPEAKAKTAKTAPKKAAAGKAAEDKGTDKAAKSAKSPRKPAKSKSAKPKE